MKGWLLLGMCGLFKAEGLVLLFAVWAAFAVHTAISDRTMPLNVGRHAILFWTCRLALAAALPLLWHIGCHIGGAEFYDYATVRDMDFHRLFTAMVYLLKIAFLEPWRFGFAYLIVLIVVAIMIVHLVGIGRARLATGLTISALTALIGLALFAFVYSLSTTPDLSWHLWSSAPRLLWAPSLFVLVECVAWHRRPPSRTSLRYSN